MPPFNLSSPAQRAVSLVDFRAVGIGLCLLLAVPARSDAPLGFRRMVLETRFYCEGIAYGDINRDGRTDIIAGPFWWEGPEFDRRHTIYEPVVADLKRHSKNFFAFTYDFNRDGWTDVMVFGFPGQDASWFENPQGAAVPWTRHLAFPTVGNESPDFVDIDRDGRPEIVCVSDGRYGYAAANWRQPDAPWTFHPITPPGTLAKFTHGLGVGDVNNDGRVDLLEKYGWWEQPSSLVGDPVWKHHAASFAEGRGGAQMFAVDLSGDGQPDIISGHHGHRYGLSWFEAKHSSGGGKSWVQHPILSIDPAEKLNGVQFSQVHAIALADMDGDGLKDIVTGKRWWAHGPTNKDPDTNGPAVVYIFMQRRDAQGKVTFEPVLVDDDSGVGTQVAVGDVNDDGCPDILCANKKGVTIFLSIERSS